MKQINDFEYDWCRSALDALKDQRKNLAGSRWLLFGQRLDPFQEAVIRFLGYMDRELELDLSVTVWQGMRILTPRFRRSPLPMWKILTLSGNRWRRISAFISDMPQPDGGLPHPPPKERGLSGGIGQLLPAGLCAFPDGVTGTILSPSPPRKGSSAAFLPTRNGNSPGKWRR